MHVTTLEKAISDAWERKHSLWEKTGAIRLLNAEASGTPRIVLELYGKHAVLFDYGVAGNAEADWIESLRGHAPRWMRSFGFESVSRLDRTRAGDSGRSGNDALAGDPPESITIREQALAFRLEPRHPRNVGLFLDTRELRRELFEHASGARVLNLFCYTGSLGLAALAGGAAEVTQVDISARYLDWARENVRLNTLPEERCRFSKMDSERYLDWATKKGLRFDHIILDPPVFSRFDGKVFRWAEDYFRLAEKCAALLAPGGILHAVTNYAEIRPSEFATALTAAFRAAGLKSEPPRRIPLPEDYDLAADAEELPEGNAMIFGLTRQ
jgi:23S rRNA (cytosine1962-C5)-methyltransferase